jgi:hypothetical protein
MDGECPFAEQVRGVTAIDGSMVDHVGFCDHTAGGFLSTMRRADFWNTAGVSAHFAIGRRGEIVQVVNIFRQAWAQGRLGPSVTWRPFEVMMGGRNPNGYLISIEHEDAELVNGRTVFVPDATWTPEQYAADLRVKRWCIEEVRRVTGREMLRFGIDSLAGHHMFDGVNRANCPGPAWRNEYRERLYRDLTTGGEEMDPAKEEELADRRAYALLQRELIERYRCVPVRKEGNDLVLELRNPDRTPLAQPIFIPVRER